MMNNFRRTTLYTGVTGNLVRRVYEHKNNFIKGFTSGYSLHDLVYFEIFEDSISAIAREKQIKGYSRKKKDQLIIKFNPQLRGLYSRIV